MITFTVFGVAVAKGSMKSFAYQLKNRKTGQPLLDRKGKPIYRAATTAENPKTKNWEQLVAEAASRSLSGSGVLFHGPIRLAIMFYLQRPKSLPRTRMVPHLKKPDCTKLARGTEDALTGVVFRDDSQVVQLEISKHYAGIGESPRAVVTIEPLDAAERLFFESERTAPHEDTQGPSQAEEALVHPDRP